MNERLGRLIADAIHEAVYGREEVTACAWCEAMPDEPHHPRCPEADGSAADEIQFCDRCLCSYVTTCDCAEDDDNR